MKKRGISVSDNYKVQDNIQTTMTHIIRGYEKKVEDKVGSLRATAVRNFNLSGEYLHFTSHQGSFPALKKKLGDNVLMLSPQTFGLINGGAYLIARNQPDHKFLTGINDVWSKQYTLMNRILNTDLKFYHPEAHQGPLKEFETSRELTKRVVSVSAQDQKPSENPYYIRFKVARKAKKK